MCKTVDGVKDNSKLSVSVMEHTLSIKPLVNFNHQVDTPKSSLIETQLEDCLDQPDLWSCIWDIFLTITHATGPTSLNSETMNFFFIYLEI